MMMKINRLNISWHLTGRPPTGEEKAGDRILTFNLHSSDL